MKGKEIPEQEAEHSKWMGGNFFYFSPRREISLYIYMCVCVCVCVCVCIYMCVCVCIYIYVFNWRLLIGDFTILWWFLPYIHMNQPWMYMCY